MSKSGPLDVEKGIQIVHTKLKKLTKKYGPMVKAKISQAEGQLFDSLKTVFFFLHFFFPFIFWPFYSFP